MRNGAAADGRWAPADPHVRVTRLMKGDRLSALRDYRLPGRSAELACDSLLSRWIDDGAGGCMAKRRPSRVDSSNRPPPAEASPASSHPARARAPTIPPRGSNPNLLLA